MSSAKSAKKRVLVIEDDGVLRQELLGIFDVAGFSAVGTAGNQGVLAQIRKKSFDVVVLDLGLARVDVLDILRQIEKLDSPPAVIALGSDDTPTAVVQAIGERAYPYLVKPTPPSSILESVVQVFSAQNCLTIEVISARPEWVELLVPCALEAVARVQGVVETLADLPADLRKSVGQAFRELLMNAVEWGGQLDPNRTVRIACLRTKDLLLYRIADPGPGFSLDQLPHAAIGNQAGEPYGHMEVREQKGLRPGGFGLLVTRAIVDELIYNERRNEVVFLKRLPQH